MKEEADKDKVSEKQKGMESIVQGEGLALGGGKRRRWHSEGV